MPPEWPPPLLRRSNTMITEDQCDGCGGPYVCQECDGNGWCPRCSGTGTEESGQRCEICHGSGNCQPCAGEGYCADCKNRGGHHRDAAKRAGLWGQALAGKCKEGETR